MFELEKAIADWRKQMLAAGIGSPAPLEELEVHLREEIVQQTTSGLKEPEAFALAIRKIGQPRLLKREFAKTGGFYGFLSKRRTLKITLSVTRLLGVFWLICLSSTFRFADFVTHITNAKALSVLLIFVAAFVGSVLLIFDPEVGRKIVRVVALICLATWVGQDCLFNFVASHDPAFMNRISFHTIIAEQGMALAFMIVSILVLHLPESANVKTTVKL